MTRWREASPLAVRQHKKNSSFWEPKTNHSVKRSSQNCRATWRRATLGWKLWMIICNVASKDCERNHRNQEARPLPLKLPRSIQRCSRKCLPSALQMARIASRQANNSVASFAKCHWTIFTCQRKLKGFYTRIKLYPLISLTTFRTKAVSLVKLHLAMVPKKVYLIEAKQ